jgi:hypothetical protein
MCGGRVVDDFCAPAGGANTTMITDAHGFPAGFRRGFCFADSKHRDSAAQRYLQRKIDLHNASHVGHNPTPSLEKLRALADGAYQDRKQRMANAWRRPV